MLDIAVIVSWLPSDAGMFGKTFRQALQRPIFTLRVAQYEYAKGQKKSRGLMTKVIPQTRVLDQVTSCIKGW